jgi:hypothetical protein
MTLYCAQCLLAYKVNDSMYEHLTALDPHGNKTVGCPQCAVVVPNFEEFVSHIEETTHPKIPENDGLVASDSMSKFIGVSAFTTKGCPYCRIQFPDDPRLDQLYEHTLAEHFCRWCRTRHPSRESRDHHYHNKHTVCTSCKQPFATTSNLQEHQTASGHFSGLLAGASAPSIPLRDLLEVDSGPRSIGATSRTPPRVQAVRLLRFFAWLLRYIATERKMKQSKSSEKRSDLRNICCPGF